MLPHVRRQRRRRWILINKGFLPTDISGIKLWLAANRGLNLSDGDPVGTWPDQSGNGNDATQGTGAAKPTYKTNILNGKPIVRFDGTDDNLRTANFGLVQPEHVFCVFKLKRDTVNDTLFDGLGGNLMRFYRSGAGPVLGLYAGGAVGSIAVATTDFYIGSCLFNGVSSELRINGGSTVSGDVGANNASGVTLGAYGTVVDFAETDIAEIFIYDSALSTANRLSVERYLSSKYGITLT